ncbi:hypothetical protein FB451DRAFT_1174448 [Mycena latifolia]|nr:hypothetical protein FB451DRAFT_1174448 [Mycena latifolia]
MPRGARTPASRSHNMPTGGKAPPFPPLPNRCPEAGCPWSFARKGCLKRHSRKHMSSEEREEHMIHCAEPGCTHKTLQRSNMNTHYIAKHTGLKPHIRTECTYCAADPSCLYRHILALHPGSEREMNVPRSRKAKQSVPSATFPELASPAASPLYPDVTSSAWTTPSRVSATEPLPFSLGYPASPSHDDQFTPDAWTPPALSPSSSIESLPYSLAYPSTPSAEDLLTTDDQFTPAAWTPPARSPSSSIESLPYSLAYPSSPSAEDLFTTDIVFYPDASCPSSSAELSMPPSPISADSNWMWALDVCDAMGIVAPLPLADPALHQPAESLESFISADDPSLFLPEPVQPAPSFPPFIYDSASCTLEHSALTLEPPPFMGEWAHTFY